MSIELRQVVNARRSGPAASCCAQRLSARQKGLRRSAVAAAVALGAASLIATSSLVTGWAVAGDGRHAAAPVDPAAAAAIEHANALSSAFRNATQTIRPSVVSIEAIRRADVRRTSQGGPGRSPRMIPMPAPGPGADPDELFRRFFGEGAAPEGRPLPMPMPEMRGQGSGVIVAEDGYIVTNNHVIAGASELRVTLDDGRRFDAIVIGTDPETDLAVIKIDAAASGSLIAARIGRSEDLEQGDWVVAVGSPYGLSQTVTAGIVSATQRGNVGVALFEDFIQTDAAINPGNSGGPLVNLRGEVVGINTAIRSGAGGSDGIGFAIPTSTVRTVVDGLRSGGVERGYLGVRPQPLDEALARSFDYDGRGVLVADAVEGEPGAKAGLRAGDIIAKVNGRSIESPAELVNAIGSMAPGASARLDVFRDGRMRTIDAVLGQRPSMNRVAADSGPQAEPARPDPLEELGMRVAPIDDAARQRFAIGDDSGVVVSAIAPNSPAAQAGLQPGDVILSVGRAEIADLAGLSAALDERDSESPLRLRVRSSGGLVRFVVIR
ncbi:MAG TPA: Do family serine endopeptidase [Phycisphaerales bacterium]|nr:Do family serine endopeptidase [Phycisphaerales bacterium]HMP38217.1 Do family serine endopeptidase [Phycisphaerales bacterium]